MQIRILSTGKNRIFHAVDSVCVHAIHFEEFGEGERRSDFAGEDVLVGFTPDRESVAASA